MGKKRALLVAINDYVGQANDLPSCVNDAHAIENLVKNDFGFTDTKALFDSAATIANVEQGLTWLFDNVAFDDNLLFFYSGHGYQMPNGNVLEESLVLYDGFWADDKLSALTQPLPTGVLTVILDSCFSGGLEKKLKDFIAASQETTWVKWWTPETGEQLIHDIDVDKTVKQFRPFGCFPVETNMSVKSLAKAFKNLSESDEAGQLQLNGILISACSENETAAASTSFTNGLSAFTYCFGTAITTLPQSSSIQDLVAESNRLLKSMSFRQTPMVKANPENLSGRALLSGKFATKGFSFSAGGGIATPFGGGNIGAGLEFKGWEQAVPLAVEIVRALSKGQSQEKIFGIDDAILIPAIASVAVAALSKGQTGAGVPSGQSQEKIFGIDDAILIPAIASVAVAALSKGQTGAGVPSTKGWEDAVPLAVEIVRALSKEKGFSFSAGGGIATPFGGGNIGAGLAFKGWEQAVPLAVEIVRALSKGQSQEKIFGIDDAILIPVIATVAAEVIRRS